MKRAILLLAAAGALLLGATAEDNTRTAAAQVKHLSTALNHITVLEFGEPVTQAAAGSSAFDIEWHQDKVLIKPMRPGASTDLFVWTASRRFTYELDPPGEPKNMNYAVDNPAVAAKPIPSPDSQMKEVADMVLTRTLLGADRIDSSTIRNHEGSIVVRVENVFQSVNGLYVRYSITNLTVQPYGMEKPTISQILPVRPRVSLISLEKTQLDARMLRALRDASRNALTISSLANTKESLARGETGRGVIVLRQQFTSPTVLELTFPDAGDRHVTAVFVF